MRAVPRREGEAFTFPSCSPHQQQPAQTDFWTANSYPSLVSWAPMVEMAQRGDLSLPQPCDPNHIRPPGLPVRELWHPGQVTSLGGHRFRGALAPPTSPPFSPTHLYATCLCPFACSPTTCFPHCLNSLSPPLPMVLGRGRH